VAEFKVGIVGLDSSHSIEFTRLIQGDAPDGLRIDGMRVVSCMRFPSPFQEEGGQDERQVQLEKWGVEVTESLDQAIEGVDGILLELNDPVMHLEFFEKVAPLGKPIFLDKPLANSLEDAKKIVALAEKHSTAVWSSSSIRFIDALVEARREISDPLLCSVYGPLGKASAGSDLVWYGVHTLEMLTMLMGRGAESVYAAQDEKGIVMIVRYGDGRRGIAECNEGLYKYGGRLQSAESVRTFSADSTNSIYYNLLIKIRESFIDGKPPVPLDDALEIMAVIDAAERSLTAGAMVQTEL